jgi:DNA repair protein RadC
MGVDPLATRGADRIATGKVAAVGKTRQVTLNDHIVVADPDGWCSMAELGWC